MYQRDLLPSFAGINTFARAPRGSVDGLNAGVVAVASITHDGTSSSRQGVRQGPKSIREASADFIFDVQGSSSQSMVNVLTGRTISLPREGTLIDLGDLPVYPMDLARTLASCRDAVSAIAAKGAFPVLLGGDHYVTFPLIEGFKSALGGNVGLIQLSSQLDLGRAGRGLGAAIGTAPRCGASWTTASSRGRTSHSWARRATSRTGNGSSQTIPAPRSSPRTP